MPSTRPIKLDDWGISWEEYKELHYFCLQYNRKKADAAALLTIKLSTPTPVTYHKKVGDKSIEYGEFLPHGSGHVSDPVAATAAKRERLLRDVRMIEQAAHEAGKIDAGYNIASELLVAVTTRGGVQAAMAKLSPACNKNEFYAARRRFFWILREMKNSEMERIKG